jgi:hypothetical protein
MKKNSKGVTINKKDQQKRDKMSIQKCRPTLNLLVLGKKSGNDPLSLVILIPFPQSQPFPAKHQKD